MTMIDAAQIDRLRAAFSDRLAAVRTDAELRAVRDEYLARKGGVVAGLMKEVAAAPAADRPALGRLANALKQELERALEARAAEMSRARPAAASLDVSLPGRVPLVGRQHPLTLLRQQIETIFSRMGYQVVEGPEAEDEYHDFEALNMPPEHPARDMQDTLYLARPIPQMTKAGRTAPGQDASAPRATLLRTHTSPMQIRYMETHQPPVRIIVPGRVFRRDDLDLTHSPMFHQVEGLVVGEGITMSDLKGTLIAFLRELFEPETRVMFRPTFFPYTEPSADVFIGCLFCGGGGCPICKKTGWLEVLGSGMVHPAVFEAVGYDAERYTGFAFGIGIERIAQLKYRIDDIRLFFENDLRFLEQFPL
ncbi:MAG: phenylalanine--tRNA ligase subunit alpha [Vicinamibacterales bacterium]